MLAGDHNEQWIALDVTAFLSDWRFRATGKVLPVNSLTAEILEVRVIHPAIAQSLVGKVVSVLEDRQPRHQPRRQRRLAGLSVCPVVDLIAFGKMNDLLGIVRLPIQRQNDYARAVFDEVGLPARGFVLCCFNCDPEKPRDGFMIVGGRSVAMLLAPHAIKRLGEP